MLTKTEAAENVQRRYLAGENLGDIAKSLEKIGVIFQGPDDSHWTIFRVKEVLWGLAGFDEGRLPDHELLFIGPSGIDTDPREEAGGLWKYKEQIDERKRAQVVSSEEWLDESAWECIMERGVEWVMRFHRYVLLSARFSS